MYLSRIKIVNYKSIKEIDIRLSKGKNVIVGRNNAGKSNIIKAIDIVLGENSPDYQKSENIGINDFYTYKVNDSDGKIISKISNEIYIYCELTRDIDEEIEYDKMDECRGFYKYNSLKSDISVESIDNLFAIKLDSLSYTEKKYINPKKDIDYLRDEFEDKYIFAFVFIAKIDEDENISKSIRFFYRENEDSNWTMTFSAPIRNELLQSAIIPSFRDTTSQLRITQWSWYGKLMKYLVQNSAKQDELKKVYKNVNGISQEIFNDLREKINDENFLVAFPGTKLLFQLDCDMKNDLYKNATIYIDDGFKSEITDKGAGIQSATIIGLFSYYVNYVNTKTSALLCIEEPELYLHPHACRVISNRMDRFIKDNKNQVIITTHNPEFLKTMQPDMNVISVRKNNGNTTTKQVQMKEFKEIFLDSNQNELFFADKVIICEGYDSYIIKWIADEFYPDKLNEKNVSVINANGKDNISKFVKLTMKLGIDTYVIADFDYFLRDKDYEKIKIYKEKGFTIKIHENIENLGEEFFVHRFNKEGKKMYSSIMRTRSYIKEKFEEQFYTAKTIEELRTPINDDESYSKFLKWFSVLRSNGICILSGEIENVFNADFDEVRPKNKKLDFNELYKINSMIDNGKYKISDIVDCKEIKYFLQTVI